jgi:Tfp pilus assembly protein PilF
MGGMADMGGQNGLPGHGMVQDAGQADAGDPALRLTGVGSKAEMDKALKDIEGDDAKKKFEAAFRWTFAVDKTKRDVEKARANYEDILRTQPKAAPCYRGLAYAALSRGFDIDGAVVAYKKALEVKPDYAEVHYALAFLFAGSDLDKGRDHLKKALELGMPDEQGLKKVYNLP